MAIEMKVKVIKMMTTNNKHPLLSANLSAENIKKLRYAEMENANLRESLLLSGIVPFVEKLDTVHFIFFLLVLTFTGNTVHELQGRLQRAESSLSMYIENQKFCNVPGKHEYFESYQTNSIKLENKQDVENELRKTKEKLAQCETNSKVKDDKIEEMAKEIVVLQRKREKRNIDMKMLMYDKKQLELRFTENPSKKKIRVIELQ